jgi:hypothetical protein
VQAAGRSAADWHAHVQAQIDLDAGASTRDETQAIWVQTRERGAGDVAAFAAAEEIYRQRTGACERLTKVEPADDAVVACADRATDLDTAVRAGDAVNQDWSAHLDMMADKEHIERYHEMWRAMVVAAPENLEAFAAAREALSSAGRCEIGG